MRISDWSSDVCSSDLQQAEQQRGDDADRQQPEAAGAGHGWASCGGWGWGLGAGGWGLVADGARVAGASRSEEHTSVQSLMRISYAVFCLKKQKTRQQKQEHLQ